MRRATHCSVNRSTARGFTLVEIMVAVVVICVGLLGIAKMQALALSGSTVARQRSMAAFLAASLASIMHSNRTYWASAQAAADSAPTPITITSATGSIAPADLAGIAAGACNGGLSAVPTCPGTAGSQTLAASDLADWSNGVNALLPNAVTTITCPGLVQPPSCTIQMTWTEQQVMTNAQAQNASGTGQINNGGQFETPTYTLYVEP